MKTKLNIWIILLLTLCGHLCSCTDDDLVKKNIQSSSSIVGVISEDNNNTTRTTMENEADGSGYCKIYWEKGDRVMLASNEFTGDKKLCFVITPDAVNKQLANFYGPEISYGSGQHSIYAFYPYSAVKDIDYGSAKIMATMPRTQHAKLSGYTEGDKVFYYKDMSCALLRGFPTNNLSQFEQVNAGSESNPIQLKFRACVNALEADVKAPSNVYAIVKKVEIDMGTPITGDCLIPVNGWGDAEVGGGTTYNNVVVELEKEQVLKPGETLKAIAFVHRKGYPNTTCEFKVYCQIDGTDYILKKTNVSISAIGTGQLAKADFGQLALPRNDSGIFDVVYPKTITNTKQTFTFRLDGVYTDDDVKTVDLNLKGYNIDSEAANFSSFTNKGSNSLNGTTYNTWTYKLSDAEIAAKEVSVSLIPTGGVGSKSEVYLVASNFISKKNIVEISNGLLYDDNFIKDLPNDYTGKNLPVAGQECKLLFYLNSNITPDKVKVNGWNCVSSSSPAPAGFYAYETADSRIMSSTSEVANFNVTVDGNKVGSIDVPVWGIKEGSALTGIGNVETSKVYIFKSNSKYLGYSGTDLQAMTDMDCSCLWKFSAKTSPSIQSAENGKYIQNNTSPQIGDASNTWTLGGTSGAMTISYKKSSGLRTDTYYLKYDGSAVTVATGTGSSNQWSIYEADYVDPTE